MKQETAHSDRPLWFRLVLLFTLLLFVFGCREGHENQDKSGRPMLSPSHAERTRRSSDQRPNSRKRQSNSRSRRFIKPMFESLEPRVMLSVLDDVPGALGAYGLRRLADAYAGSAVEVRRASDGATTDIGFTPSGDLNTAALETFAGGTDLYVTAWYDQTGGGAHLTQSDLNLQPLIVSAGTLLTDTEGLPRMQFISDSLSGTTATPISNQNLTAFFVQEADYTDKDKVILALGAPTATHKWLQYRLRDWDAVVSIGNGVAEAVLTNEAADTLYPFLQSIQILESQGQTVRLLRNTTETATFTHAMSEGTSSQVHIGVLHRGTSDRYYDGFISEMLLYPALSEADRLQVYGNLNDHFQTGGPEQINEGALLPQDWQWEVELYDWLETIQEADVTTSPTDFQWDGTYADIAPLEELWMGFAGGASEYTEDNMEIVRSEAKWWVLDDGNGAGIEGSGSVRFFHDASEAAFWYTQSLPLSGGGQGNPYYRDSAVARRALISAAVSMMMNDQLQATTPYMLSAMNIGGPMRGWVWAYRESKDVLDANTQAAFEAGFRFMTEKILEGGAHDVNGNIDTHAIASLAHLYKTFSDPGDKDLVLRATKKVLFGSETGTPDTTDYATGIYRRAGYIDEGDSPETTYNGASLINLLQAQAVTRDEPEWDFMDTVVRSMLDFKFYQYFPDPDGFFDGPSGYAGRTGGSYVYDQRTLLWRDYTAAATFEEGRPLARYGRKSIQSESEMVDYIQNAISYYNSRGIGTPSTSDAPGFGFTRFPTENLYFPESGWQPVLKALVDNADPTTFTPYERTDDINKTFDNEFWAYKGDDPNQEFGFFVETLADPGNYSGWYGGSLQTFWTENAGMVILARHDKSGSDYPLENTRVWSVIDTWATHHVWGRDETGAAFSVAASNQHDRAVTYDLNGSSPSASVQSTLGGGSSRGQQTGNEIQGNVTFTNAFQATPNGLEITHTITSDQADQITELWATLPVFLRDTDQNMADTTIAYWDGLGWQSVGTSLVTTARLRLRCGRAARGAVVG